MGESAQPTVWLVGDVGATNARFGLVNPDGAIVHSGVLACADFPRIGDALHTYLGRRGRLPIPRIGALAHDQSSVELFG
jgi:glucokinase